MAKSLILVQAILFCNLSIGVTGYAQNCNCEKELMHIKNFIERNYAGFPDKLKAISKTVYEKRTNELLGAAKSMSDNETCIYIVKQYLDQFKDNHMGFRFIPDSTPNTAVRKQREMFNLEEKKIKELEKKNSGWEGIYNFRYDTTYKIAVIQHKSAIHDYVGVIIESKLPNWKRGMIKWEGKLVKDSLIRGALYQRFNGLSFEGFRLAENRIDGDWRRDGAPPEDPEAIKAIMESMRPSPQGSKKISDNIFYIKISSFAPSNAHAIDSIFKANDSILDHTPYLILDLRGNGGGSDFSYEPIVKYVYTTPYKSIGVDALATEENIAGWKKILDNKDISDENKKWVEEKIRKMESNKGKFVNIGNDEIDSSYTPRPFPKKIAILINNGCSSTTEQFLLFARQSSKVILLGQNTSGTLDYSNMQETPFLCLRYKLVYATTRSRRLDINQGIDNIGIAPDYYLNPGLDWISEATRILER